MAAEHRRRRVAVLMRSADLSVPGWRSDIARELNVHRSTVCRDVLAIVAEAKEQREKKLDRDLAEFKHRYRFVAMADLTWLRWSLQNLRDRLRNSLADSGSAETES